jgi:hypothetical protein
MDITNALEAIEGIRSTVPENDLKQFDQLLHGRSAARLGLTGEVAGPVVVEATAEIDLITPVEIDPATLEAVEALPTAYGEQVVARYNAKHQAVEEAIRAGKLPEGYRLPELSSFMNKIADLTATFEHIEDVGQPTFEFFPRGLSPDQWNDLLHGHTLADGQTSTGAWRGLPNEPSDPTDREVSDSNWGVVVIDAQERPAISGISADGSRAVGGFDVKSAIEYLKKSPEVTATSADLIVRQVSPSEDAFRGTQLARLERGEAPLDSRTWTILKDNVKVDWTLKPVFGNWYPNRRKVNSLWGSLGNPNENNVVRVSGER